MGLVKADDVEFLELEEEIVDEYIVDDTAVYFPYSTSQKLRPTHVELEEVPVILGNPDMEYDYESLIVAPAVEDFGTEIYFTSQNTEVLLGDTVTIGIPKKVEVIEEESYEEDSYEEDSYEEDYYEEEIVEEEEEDKEEFEDDEASLQAEMMAGGLAQAAAEDAAAAAAFAESQGAMLSEVDNQVAALLESQKSGPIDESEFNFIQEQERIRLISEALDDIKDMAEQDDSVDFEEMSQEITNYLNNLIVHHSELIRQEIEEEREQMNSNVEEYIENTLDEQRSAMREETSSYISEAVQKYKQQLHDDNEFIQNANNIVADRDNTLDESYNQSLQIMQEAETESARIMEEAKEIQEQATSFIAESEAQSNMITQEAQVEAERIIQEANMESARIIEAAEQSHQEIVDGATQDGFNVGYQEGREEAIKENAQLLLETIAALNKLHAAFPHAIKQNEDKLKKLATEIAKEVIHGVITVPVEFIDKSLNKASDLVSDLDKVVVKVNPLDLDSILPKQEYFKQLMPDVPDFLITGHYSMAKGDCIIETTSGIADIEIKTQLAVIDEIFTQMGANLEEEYGDEEYGEYGDEEYGDDEFGEYEEYGEEEYGEEEYGEEEYGEYEEFGEEASEEEYGEEDYGEEDYGEYEEFGEE